MLLWGKLLSCIYMKAEAFIYFSSLSQAKVAPYARMRDFAKSRFHRTTLYFARFLLLSSGSFWGLQATLAP